MFIITANLHELFSHSECNILAPVPYPYSPIGVCTSSKYLILAPWYAPVRKYVKFRIGAGSRSAEKPWRKINTCYEGNDYNEIPSVWSYVYRLRNDAS